jgi:hypothetical protein
MTGPMSCAARATPSAAPTRPRARARWARHRAGAGGAARRRQLADGAPALRPLHPPPLQAVRCFHASDPRRPPCPPPPTPPPPHLHPTPPHPTCTPPHPTPPHPTPPHPTPPHPTPPHPTPPHLPTHPPAGAARRHRRAAHRRRQGRPEGQQAAVCGRGGVLQGVGVRGGRHRRPQGPVSGARRLGGGAAALDAAARPGFVPPRASSVPPAAAFFCPPAAAPTPRAAAGPALAC